jgi:hypothetical protein
LDDFGQLIQHGAGLNPAFTRRTPVESGRVGCIHEVGYGLGDALDSPRLKLKNGHCCCASLYPQMTPIFAYVF